MAQTHRPIESHGIPASGCDARAHKRFGWRPPPPRTKVLAKITFQSCSMCVCVFWAISPIFPPLFCHVNGMQITRNIESRTLNEMPLNCGHLHATVVGRPTPRSCQRKEMISKSRLPATRDIGRRQQCLRRTCAQCGNDFPCPISCLNRSHLALNHPTCVCTTVSIHFSMIITLVFLANHVHVRDARKPIVRNAFHACVLGVSFVRLGLLRTIIAQRARAHYARISRRRYTHSAGR